MYILFGVYISLVFEGFVCSRSFFINLLSLLTLSKFSNGFILLLAVQFTQHITEVRPFCFSNVSNIRSPKLEKLEPTKLSNFVDVFSSSNINRVVNWPLTNNIEITQYLWWYICLTAYVENRDDYSSFSDCYKSKNTQQKKIKPMQTATLMLEEKNSFQNVTHSVSSKCWYTKRTAGYYVN